MVTFHIQATTFNILTFSLFPELPLNHVGWQLLLFSYILSPPININSTKKYMQVWDMIDKTISGAHNNNKEEEGDPTLGSSSGCPACAAGWVPCATLVHI